MSKSKVISTDDILATLCHSVTGVLTSAQEDAKPWRHAAMQTKSTKREVDPPQTWRPAGTSATPVRGKTARSQMGFKLAPLSTHPAALQD